MLLVVGEIERLISVFHEDSENIFKKILELIDEHKVTRDMEMIEYFWSLLWQKRFTEYANEFAEKYNL